MGQVSPPKIDGLVIIILLIIVILVTAKSIKDLQQPSFTIEGGTDFEVKRALTIKALQLFKVSNDSIVCSDNILEYNIIGYRLMSYEGIQDIADVLGDVRYISVSVVDLNGSDASITVGNAYATPRNATYVILAGDGIIYQFHRYFQNHGRWNDDVHFIS
ncbi:MAG: hypothetical protein WC941_06260 [Candidatus Bathyarchaeia archaeon]